MTIWTPNDNAYVDLSSYDSFVHGVPHNTFKRLRDEDPCHWTEYQGGQDFWSITRHADILELNKQPQIFSSEHGIRIEDQSEEEYLARRTFQEIDPPEHTAFRMKVAKAFSKPVIAGYEKDIRSICDKLLDDVMEKGEFDATQDLARQLPLQMLGRIVGLPDEDLEWLVSKGDELIANTDPDYTDHVLDKMDTDEYRLLPFNSPAGADLYDYARELLEKRKASGDSSGIINLVLEDDDGVKMSESDFRNLFCLLVAAGNDTTRYSIAAGIHAFANQDGLLDQLRASDETVWQTAADEFIRWASPTMYFRRTATQDYKLHDKTIKEGDKVVYWFNSANRDERVFDDPFHVNLLRTPNRHIAFGQGGPHVCLGMWLARLEIRVFFEAIATRIQKVEMNGDIEYLRSNFIGGIKKLPVKVTPIQS